MTTKAGRFSFSVPRPYEAQAPERRPAAEDGAGVHLADATRMVNAVRNAGMDHGEIVGVLSHVGKPVRNPQAAFTVLPPRTPALKQRRFGFTCSGEWRLETVGQGLASKFVEQWFAVKCIQVAGTAFHEEKDDVLRLCLVVGDGLSGIALERGEGQRTKSAASGLQELAAGVGVIVSMATHGFAFSGGRRIRWSSATPGRDRSWPVGEGRWLRHRLRHRSR